MSTASDRSSSTRLGVATSFNLSFGVVQVVVGLAIGSAVVLADSIHQAVDAIGLLLALVATRIALRPANDRWSYGLGKADALGGLLSSVLLLASVTWIAFESIRRLTDPSPVSGAAVVAIGLIAIAVNGAGVLLVSDRHDHGLDGRPGHDHPSDADRAVAVRAARLHLLTDLAGSVIVVATGVLLSLGVSPIVDPLASLVVSAAVVMATLRVLRTSIRLLLDGVPHDASLAEVRSIIEGQDGVREVHHLHVRPLGGGGRTASAHVVVDDAPDLHRAQGVADRIHAALREESGIAHATVQLECHPCGVPCDTSR